MQQVQTREVNISGRYQPNPWRTDESAMVNALMGAVWRHHVNRRTRIRTLFSRLVRRPRLSGSGTAQ